MNKEEAIRIYSDVRKAMRTGQHDFETAPDYLYDAYEFLTKEGLKQEATNYVEAQIKAEEKELSKLKEEYYNFLTPNNYTKEDDKKFRQKFYAISISGKEEEEVKYRITHNGEAPSKEELSRILRDRWLKDDEKKVQFLEEKIKEEKGDSVDTERLKDAEEYLDNYGLLPLAYKYLDKAIKQENFIKQKKEEIEVLKKGYKADKATQKLYNILEEFNIWRLGKYDEELKEIKSTLEKNDRLYLSRVELYKRLIELPKFKKLDEDERIELAMKLGALDFGDLSYRKE